MTSGDRRAGLLRLLNEVESLRRLLRLYPGGHPTLGPAEERIRASAAALVGVGMVTIALGPDRVYLDAEEIPLPSSAPASRVVRLLFHLGMAGLRLDGRSAADGLVVLGRELATLREPPGESDRQLLLDAADRLTGVELVPIDLSSVHLVGQESLERGERTRLIWQELAARLARSGVFPLAGSVADGELSPGAVVALARSGGRPGVALRSPVHPARRGPGRGRRLPSAGPDGRGASLPR